MAAKSSMTFRFDDEQRNKLQQRAEARGESSSALIRDSIDITADLEQPLWDRIDKLSRAANLKPSEVIKNIVIGWLAKRDANREVWGMEMTTLEEFCFSEDGPVTGMELYRQIKSSEEHDQKMRKNKIELERELLMLRKHNPSTE